MAVTQRGHIEYPHAPQLTDCTPGLCLSPETGHLRAHRRVSLHLQGHTCVTALQTSSFTSHSERCPQTPLRCPDGSDLMTENRSHRGGGVRAGCGGLGEVLHLMTFICLLLKLTTFFSGGNGARTLFLPFFNMPLKK